MPLITLRRIQLGFGGPNLLDGVDLAVEPGERICLIGRNGTGKSTLMRIIAGELKPDDGEISMGQGMRVARLSQEVPEGIQGSVFDVVAGGVGDLSDLLGRYHRLSSDLGNGDGDGRGLAELDRLHQELDAIGGWQVEQRVEQVVSRLGLPADAPFSELSGGLKRRVLLGRALVTEPDLLLLDEPTNHLDIAAIDWLEQFLLGYRGALLFVTHDRMFLQRLATRIIELDRGQLRDWPGDYENYLRRKEEALAVEAREHAQLDKVLAREEAWVRQGIKARRRRNEGRVRALEKLRVERRQRREQQGQVRLRIQDGEKSGRLVVSAEKVDYSWGDRPVIRDFSTTILRGDKVGLIGPNGVGKTTLLNLLLGRLQPDSGRITQGSKLELAYFDQLRSQLEEEKTVRDNLSGGSDQVAIDGHTQHVIGYLQDFLFSPERANTPVKALSGGERNRLLLARLFTRQANLLVMDEPTNDLDVETLELLEQRLLDYPGTLLLVSHDRAFLNNIVTSSLVFEGDGRVREYIGGYDDWLRQRRSPAAEEKDGPARKKAQPPPAERQKRPAEKLSYKDQRELDALPAEIEALETEQAQLQAELQDPRFYQQQSDRIAETRGRLEALQRNLEHAYERWEALEARL